MAPKLLALHICGKAVTNPLTAETSLHDIGSVFFPLKEPMQPLEHDLFCHLSIEGEVTIDFLMKRRGEEKVVWGVRLPNRTANQADGTTTEIVHINAPIAGYGFYDVEVHVDGKFVDSRWIRVVKPT